MNNKVLGITTSCIVCLSPATSHGGHVVKDSTVVLAGFCADHVKEYSGHQPILAMRIGCFGGWLPEYGFEERTFYEPEEQP